ncbi:hypothetical protein FA15DRAFT_707058 [Coprinopsis marcescibilis]|uniref:DNA damage-responsive protein 48 n=1 Tax=Coprinopsis marcescibilis TaxID=230819 RepID=A0A5C3KP36_COPMA|nr:hypothetical protein FA15DRAFT_707058 [Coprinopsis marcescibilis]
MDFFKSNKTSGQQEQGSGGLMGKINESMGGGQKGEQKEDYLDKGVDFVQERFMGQGQQNNESAMEQAKDEQISDAIRRGFKSTSGRDFPVGDK